MDPQFITLLRERFESLPEKLQNLIMRPSLASSVQIVAEKHRLPEDKAGILREMVTLTLLTFEDSNRFEERIMEELLIPGSVATSIARDIDTTIFVEAREEMKQAWNERKAHEASLPKETMPVAKSTPVFQKRLIEEATPVSASPLATHQYQPPSYTKPLTNMPQYTEDPYREKPE
jgi:hypothetical protein